MTLASAFHRADRLAARLQRLHDVRVVRPSQVHRPATVVGGGGELGHRLHRILLRRAGQSLGYAVGSAAELKTMQEVITLTVFAGFSVLYLGERITNHAVGFALICAGAFFVFRPPGRTDPER